MERVNSILNHPHYIDHLKKISKAEVDRGFCRHNLQHFLDVARVAYIIVLEKDIKIPKDMIYAAALLHDIGRWKQYEDGTDHALLSAEIAEGLLYECKFNQQEIALIVEAIRKHRKGKNLSTDLEKVIYEGDKMSRLCIECNKTIECKRYVQEKDSLIRY